MHGLVISMFVILIIAVVVSIEDLQCCMLGMKVHMFKLSCCISPRQYKTVFFPCYLCNMCSLLAVISGKSGVTVIAINLIYGPKARCA